MNNILLVYGGKSVEHDISILTALQAWNNIDVSKYNLIPYYLRDSEGYTGDYSSLGSVGAYINWKEKAHKRAFIINGKLAIIKRKKIRKKLKIDCALICCHGGEGEGGLAQAMFEMNNIPYTSSDMYRSYICMNKALTHQKVKKLGVKSVNYVLVNRDNYLDKIDLIIKRLGRYLIVKPNNLGSSIGVGFANNREELINCLEIAATYDNEIIVEERVTNVVELNCAVIGNSTEIVVSDIERPITAKEVLDFSDKYTSNGKMSGCGREFPANIEEWLAKSIKEISAKVYTGLQLAGVVRIDYLYDRENSILYLNEVNNIPGSLAFYLFKNKFNFEQLLDMMITDAIDRYNSKSDVVTQFSSSVLSINKNNGVKNLQKV